MAQYTKAQVTQLGLNLNAKVLGSEPHVLEFTRIVTSDTDYKDNNLVLMEGITNIRQTGSLSGTVVQDDQFNVKGTFDTADIESGYYMRTIALYANDPDKGEILYAVVACDPADYIHSRGDVGDSIIHFDFAIKVTGAQNVTITIPTTGLVTVHEINDIRDELDNQFAGLEDEINSDFSSLSADIDQRFQTKTSELNTSFTNLTNTLTTRIDNKIVDLEDGFGMFKTATQNEIDAFKAAAQDDIDSKTAAMQSSVTSNINSMNSQMDTHTTNVNNLISEGEDLYEDMRDQSTQLDTKFTNKSSELDNKFNTLEDTYDDRVTSLEGRTKTLEELEVELTQAVQGGGRQLARQTETARWVRYALGMVTSVDTESDPVLIRTTATSAGTNLTMGAGQHHLTSANYLEAGEEYTLSTWARSSIPNLNVNYVYIMNKGAGYNQSLNHSTTSSRARLDPSSEFTQLHWTFVADEITGSSENYLMLSSRGNFEVGDWWEFTPPMLVKGRIPFEHTRAPEDIEADIKAAKDGADQANTIIGSGFFSESGATPSTTFPVTINPTNDVQTFEIPLTTQWVAGKHYRIDIEGDFPYATKLKLHPANLKGGNEFNVVSGSFQKYVDVTTLQNTQSPKMVFTIDSTPHTPDEGEPEPNTRATRINSVKVVSLEGETLTQRSIRHQNEIKALESAVPTKLDKSAVTNNLTSTSTTNALSAAQGKALADGLGSRYTKAETDGLLEEKADKSKVPAETGLQTVAEKSQYYPVAQDNTGRVTGIYQVNLWSKSEWLSTTGNGVGVQALQNNTGGDSNGIGDSALQNNTGIQSNGVGYSALQNNTGGFSNGIGQRALEDNTGVQSNGVGSSALQNNTGHFSNGIGQRALEDNTGGRSNGIGDSALQNNKGDQSNGVGSSALRNNIGSNNSAFGHNANNTTNKTIRELSNTTCLGANTLPNKSNQVVLGDGSVDTIKMGGTARTPASSTAPGIKGETCWDTDYFYICVATDIWKRIKLEVW